MKKYTLTSLFILFALLSFSKEKVLQGSAASQKIQGAELIRINDNSALPGFVKFRKGSEINISGFSFWIKQLYKNSDDINISLINKETDRSGFIHYRYQINYKNIPVEFSMVIAHTKNGKVCSFNGDLKEPLNTNIIPALDENTALAKALENFPAATYYPKGSLVIFPTKNSGLRLAYKFNIYTPKPLKKADVYIDAVTGIKLFENNRIQTTDVTGTAVTKYSGTQMITTDSYSGSFRLRETGRGNGIETYDMNTGTDYQAALDFTDADNYWNNVNTDQDEVATDAHWATEKTYDYYFLRHGRNSIDNNGFTLISYVHYDSGYSNAFWDGECMTYGDGNQNYSPLTTVDICGHEITHGVTNFTANLTYAEESGALSEGYSDIFGTCIEFYAKPSLANWTLGEDIGETFRSLSDPASMGYPDTYQGQDWDPNQEVHHNSTVLSHWFYLISIGGSGANDLGNSYSVTGITIDSAALVAFRTLTVYLTPSSTYADARYYSIQAAIDIFGPCTSEVEVVTNAWYAVGIGSLYVPNVVSDFTADFTALCSAPASVQFQNLSSNGSVFIWNFGDGNTSTQTNPAHTYNTQGNFDVSLYVSGGSCGSDTLVKTAYISISPANPCIVIMPQSGSSTVTYCMGKLFDSGGQQNYQDNTDVTVTIAPPGASSITLNFISFDFEINYDYLYIYDGPNTSSALIGQFDGTALPNGGIINSTGGSITLRQTTDQGLTKPGFELDWQCSTPNSAPVANFNANVTTSCTGIIQFSDMSSNAPTGWIWDFGDGYTSTWNNPVHQYNGNGMYSVSLIASNTFGSDTITKTNYININMPVAPAVSNDTVCTNQSAVLYATGTGTINWYDSLTASNILFTGDTFTTPALTQTTTYYVESEFSDSSHYAGKTDNSGAGGYYTSTSPHYLIFDCSTALIIKSVKVYASDAGNRTIQLQNSTGSVIQSLTANIPAGESRVTLNFSVAAGTNFRLAISPPDCNLFRNGSQSSPDLPYPYEIPGMISITGNSAGNPKYYYYFYDWEVSTPTCNSPRAPVTVFVDNCSDVTLLNNQNDFNLYPNPACDKLFIKTSLISNISTVTICDINGRILKYADINNILTHIDISDLAHGMYYCKISGKENITIKKFVVIK
ncbi:MAG: M4 family metallopeptidase [Bacteroidia bacterium]|nr:M4 family metallopeptidase [Bacteroidia bacterium]